MTTFAHLSDVHLGPLPSLRLWDWNLKRSMGRANWLRRRQYVHRPEVAARLIADLHLNHVDHVLVSGDLTNIGLPAEHAQAARWLQQIGTPEQVSVVPGNHDVYTRLLHDPGIDRWSAYASSFTTDAGTHAGTPRSATRSAHANRSRFPFVRQIDHVTLIGLNSACLSGPGMATGRVSSHQIATLIAALNEAEEQGRFRLVMIHHPPLPGQASPRRALRNAQTLASALAHHGAELVVHGHNHRFNIAWLEGPAGAIPVVGAGSCSVAPFKSRDDPASYHLYRISGDKAAGWRVELTRRGLNDPEGAVQVFSCEELSCPDPARSGLRVRSDGPAPPQGSAE